MTRTSRASPASTRPPTGRSGRRGTCSGSSSTATRRSPGSSCRTTGPGSHSARTTRSAESRWSTRAPRSRRRTPGGRTSERAQRANHGAQPPVMSRRAQRGVGMTSSTSRPAGATDPYAGSRETTEGRVYTVTGGDWDSVLAGSTDPIAEERLVVNMGPQHPSTHGVLRLVLELEGEMVVEARTVVGYLHTGIEKNTEYRNWTQGTTFVTRMDYLSNIFNETGYCLAVERLLGIEVPERATTIRVAMMELQRIASHLVWLATTGLELGALSMMIYGFRERELI